MLKFTSYAQNFEDIMLWRALRHVKNGFYIDVGAQEPVLDSVSLGFYEQGWRGVHVEATAHYADKLRIARPDETVLQIAIAAEKGVLTFFEIPDTGLSTGDREFADRHRDAGWAVVSTEVPCVPLSDILDRYRDRDIHWLKIDVEGMEALAIQGWGESAVRPWVVVMESVEPCSTVPNFADWEQQLVGLGYDFVYFDGLNRFYVSHAHPELKQHFGLPFNIFDLGEVRLAASMAFCMTAVKPPPQVIEKTVEKVVEIIVEKIIEKHVIDPRYLRLVETLRDDEGPRALRLVLPVARLLRRLRQIVGGRMIRRSQP